MTAETRPRGRPRQFDEESALDRVTEVFWKQGYEKTSVADLVEASGVHKPSLYRIFGSKEELFARVLRRYLNTRMELFGLLVASAGPGVDGIHEFLTLMRDDVVSGTSQNGCLLVATSTELHGSTPSFENFGPKYRDAVRDLLRPVAARAGGSDQIVDQRTNLLTTWFLGLDISTRGAATTEEIDDAIDAMRATVDTWR
jgi:TetR/AcrR family transcriptional repressor of nem operon